MEKKRKIRYNLNTSTDTAGDRFLRELDEMPYSTDRIGQIVITTSGRPSAETRTLSEKEANARMTEKLIQQCINEYGMTREKAEKFVRNPF